MKREAIWWGSDVGIFRIECLLSPRRRGVWANRIVAGAHPTFKRSTKGRQRSQERQFVRSI